MQNAYVAGRSLGYVQFTAGTIDAATGLTVPAGASFAMITPEAQAIRWRDDGTNPTAAVGQPLAVGSELRYDANGLGRIKFISQVAGAILNVTFFG